MSDILLRTIHKSDLYPLLEAERLSHGVEFSIPEAPLLGTVWGLQPWAWREKEFVEALSRYRRKLTHMADTRGYAAQLKIEMLDHRTGKKEAVCETVGGIIFERHEDGYEILLLTAHPEKAPPHTRDVLVEKVLRRAEDSPTRTKVRVYVPDGDWESVKFYQRLWGNPKLVRGHYGDGDDAWFFEYQAAEELPPEKTPAA
jgi:hypothetical protein